ncbi:tRNA-splicing endonuclease subunit sen54 [Mortierella sp. AD032]|nr:tRNA-splicing endonuclease subunit sen54 [Mortierella sp. AD032]
MDRYLAYAYFKRLGYVVTRPGTYDPRPIDSKPQTAATPASSELTVDTRGPGLKQILQRIRIIPTRRLVQPEDDLGQEIKKGTWKQKVDFEVYKPAGAFKKRQPGIPDYRVVVVSSKENMPTLEELSEMMGGLIDPAQDNPSLVPSDLTSTQPTDKGKKNKPPDWPKVLFAIVDGGQVSFMSLSNLQATL